MFIFVIYVVVESVKPVFERIDALESQVNDLERTIFRLDTYAKQLGLLGFTETEIIALLIIMILSAEVRYNAVEKH